MGFSTPPGHRNPTYDADRDGFIDQTKGVNVPNHAEIPSSPFDVTNQSSVTVSLSNSPNRVLVLSDPSTFGFGRLQVNGVTSGYDTTNNDGSEVTGLSFFQIPVAPSRPALRITAASGSVRYTVAGAVSPGGNMGGINFNTDTSISQFTLLSSVSRSERFRVYRLDI